MRVRTKTNEQFIADVIRVHGEALCPDEVYAGSSTKIRFKCNAGHADWRATPNSILIGKGCPECAEHKPFKSNAQFMADVFEVHGSTVCPAETYIASATKIRFKCSSGHSDWVATPNNILSGKGCPHCGKIKQSKASPKSNEQFIADVIKVHGNALRPVEIYVSNATKIRFECNNGHPEWMAQPNNVLTGTGCPFCNSGGFDMNKPGFLYYLRVVHELTGVVLYKIGITNRSVEKRFRVQDLSIISPIDVKYFANGYDAAAEERRIKGAFREYRYKGPNILSSNGDTELFTKDVLKLDHE